MPRYLFHVHDRTSRLDEDGLEFPDLESARLKNQHFPRMCRGALVQQPYVGCWQILLQKSQIARRCKKIRPTTADRCGPNHVTEVASEFIFRQ
jgi:hypothetical protein